MRAFAEFIMQGRIQAAIAIVALSGLGSLLSFGLPLDFAAAVMTLVTLRRGYAEGLLMLILASVPAIAIGNLESALTISIFGVVLCMAVVLKSMVSLPASVVSGAGIVALLLLVAPAYESEIEQFVELAVRTFNEMNPDVQINGEQRLIFEQILPSTAAVYVLMNAYLALFIGRWWQALLYNPGGFQEEFHQLRLSPAMIAALFAVCLFVGWITQYYGVFIIVIFAVFIAGLGLVHGLVGIYKIDKAWLIMFYVLLFVTTLAMGGAGYWVVFMAALMDCGLNYREKARLSRKE